MFVPFDKPARTIWDQLELLKSRGLTVEDDDRALSYLGNINYYRLSAYWYTFLEHPKQRHIFKNGTTFKQIIDTYVFDRKLRLIIFDEIERIEVSIKTRIIQEYSTCYGNNWYEDPSYFRNPDLCTKFLEVLDKEVHSSKEDFMRHFRLKYGTQHRPPCWIAFQLISFSQASILYKNLATCDSKKAVAKYYGVDEQILASWLETLSFVRNACAHHARLWNRNLPRVPQWPKRIDYPWLNTLPGRGLDNRIYTALSITRYLLSRIVDNSSFTKVLTDLLSDFPNIPTKRMGFTPLWSEEPVWKGD